MDRKRVTFEFSQIRLTEFDYLASQLGFSRSDLINNALTLFVYAIDEVKKGNYLASVNDETDTFIEVIMPVFEKIRKGSE